MITFDHKQASGKGWTKNWYNVYRNGADTGFIAFQSDDGATFSLEKSDRWEGDFQSLDQVAAFVSQRQADVAEQASKLGLI